MITTLPNLSAGSEPLAENIYTMSFRPRHSSYSYLSYYPSDKGAAGTTFITSLVMAKFGLRFENIIIPTQQGQADALGVTLQSLF